MSLLELANMSSPMYVSSLPTSKILLLLLVLYVFSVGILSTAKPLCRNDERVALVQFNESLTIKNLSSTYPLAYPKTASWDERDCCLWDGVGCDDISGYIISLDLSSSYLYGAINSSSTLFLLVHLQRLNLADNNFNFSTIPSQIGQFQRLTWLNLSSSLFYGKIPSEIAKLPNLVTLDLGRGVDAESHDAGLELETSNFMRLLQNMSSLEVLVMTNVKVSSPFPDVMELPSLAFLDMYGCGISGSIPSSFGNLTNLHYMNLGNNKLSGPIPNSIADLKNLNYIMLASNDLSGPIPSSLGHLIEITFLNIGNNSLFGEIPSALLNLTQLEVLILNINKLTGNIPSGLSNLAKLATLDLGNNQLVGSIPNLQNMTQIQTLAFSKNRFTGVIPSWLSNLTQLVAFDVGSNQLLGSIPDSIFQLGNIEYLYLGPNLLNGTLRFEMFTRLRNLKVLQLGGGNLTVHTEVGVNVSLLPKFHILTMAFCKLEVVPSFLKHQDDLYYLYLSDNKILGDVRKWLGNVSTNTLIALGLERNLFTGLEQSSMFSSFTNLQVLDLSNNKIQGPVDLILPTSISYFDASNNSLTGGISMSICASNSLAYLDLELNNLSGLIPPCLGNLENLTFLNLASNLFIGEIPKTFSNLTRLSFMSLSNNQLEGLLPSLVSCQMLESVDLSNNCIGGNFPYWLGDLPNLEVLILRSNQFSGEIGSPRNMSRFFKLRILYLSYNNFTGSLPNDLLLTLTRRKYIPPEQLVYLDSYETHKFAKIGRVVFGYDSKMTLANKGVYTTYWKISNVIAALDLSSNRFQGDISVSLGSLKMLNVLNLSNNHLSGPIPSVIGSLSNMESLDLSTNNLSGQIPLQLNQLTFLEYFNVSDNQLIGPIPQGNQLRTFENCSYGGNLGLCGKPLTKKCEDVEVSPPIEPILEKDKGSSTYFDWQIVLIGYECGVFFGLAIGFWFPTKKEEWLMMSFRIGHKRGRSTTR